VDTRQKEEDGKISEGANMSDELKHLKHFNIEDVLALNPCGRYSCEYLKTLFAGRDTLTLADVINMPEVPPSDVVWLATHIFTPWQRCDFAIRCAIDAGQATRDRTWEAARDAWEAAWEAARVAWQAARDRTWEAARDAGLTTRDARDTARGAANVVKKAARERQLLYIAETLHYTEECDND
jgi:hypothetical protein